MWWQPILDAVPPLTNGAIVGILILMIARGQLWTKAAVDRAIASVEHERDQNAVDRDFYRSAWLESQKTVMGYAEATQRVAIPAAAAAHKNLQALSDIAAGGDGNGGPAAE